jgi:hypothetical protein
VNEARTQEGGARWCADQETLTDLAQRSTFVLMEVETLGVARSRGWKAHMRCANGYRPETGPCRAASTARSWTFETLVATRAGRTSAGEAGGKADVPSLRKQEGDGCL